MRTACRKHVVRLQDLPNEIVTAILSHLDKESRESWAIASWLHSRSRSSKESRLGRIISAFDNSAVLHFRLDIGTKIISQDFTFGGILRELASRRSFLEVLEVAIVHDLRISSAFRDVSLGSRIFQQKLAFPRLRHVTFDSYTTLRLDVLPFLAHCAPHLETLVVHASYLDLGENISNAKPHHSILNLCITHSDEQNSVEMTQLLLRLCPKVRRLCLRRMACIASTPSDTKTQKAMQCLLRSLSLLPLQELESGCGIATFADRVVAGHIRLTDLRRMWLGFLPWAWDDITCAVSGPLASSWPSRGMTLEFAACLRNCPRLDTLYCLESAEPDDAARGEQAYISSYVNPIGIGELLHAVIRVNGEWIDVTDYRGEVVPFQIIDNMRTAEGITDSVWPGTERRRGRVVGDPGWALLVRWYQSGPRVTPSAASLPLETDEFRESCCLQ